MDVSIHLMLFFIQAVRAHVWGVNGFQYISCYSLSGQLLERAVKEDAFQYISCYSLSFSGRVVRSSQNRVSIHLMLFFIRLLSSPDLEKMRFNTSHVILYREKAFGFRQSRRFNTSHVILYQRSGNACCTDGIRFNTSHVILYRTSSKSGFHLLSMFQYISCYSLSAISAASMAASAVFQYISCYSLSRAWGDMRIW